MNNMKVYIKFGKSEKKSLDLSLVKHIYNLNILIKLCVDHIKLFYIFNNNSHNVTLYKYLTYHESKLINLNDSKFIKIEKNGIYVINIINYECMTLNCVIEGTKVKNKIIDKIKYHNKIVYKEEQNGLCNFEMPLSETTNKYQNSIINNFTEKVIDKSKENTNVNIFDKSKENTNVNIFDKSKENTDYYKYSNILEKKNAISGVERKKYKFGYAEGIFMNNLLYGVGRIYMDCGIIFSGNFIDGILNGYGSILFDNGTIYEGMFINNLLNGYGKITFCNDVKYEGNFINNILNGYGTITKKYGTVHKSMFINGLFDGYCKTIHIGGYTTEIYIKAVI